MCVASERPADVYASSGAHRVIDCFSDPRGWLREGPQRRARSHHAPAHVPLLASPFLSAGDAASLDEAGAMPFAGVVARVEAFVGECDVGGAARRRAVLVLDSASTLLMRAPLPAVVAFLRRAAAAVKVHPRVVSCRDCSLWHVNELAVFVFFACAALVAKVYIYVSLHLVSMHLSIIYLSICLSVCLSVRLPLCLCLSHLI